MTIDEIKKQLGLVVLNMVRQFDEQGNKTVWVSHWDNDRRIGVTMHESVMGVIKVDRSLDILDMTATKVIAKQSGKEYTRYVVTLKKKSGENLEGIWKWDKQTGSSSYYDYGNTYDKYNGYDGYSDDAIDDAFEGDPSNTWGL